MREKRLYNLCIDVLISGNAKIQILVLIIYMKWRIMSVFAKCSPLVIMLLMATVSLNVRICVFQYFSNGKN